MRCTNCGKEVPAKAKVCGHCGHRLKEAPTSVAAQFAPPTTLARSGGIPGWVWGLIGSLVALVGILALAAFLIFKPSVPSASPPGVNPPPVVSLPKEKINTPVVRPSATPTSTPTRTRTPTPTPADQRCDLFEGMKFSIIWLDVPKGSTVAQLYVKMPGGVPGLEKKISGDSKPWEYEFKIGDYTTTGCNVIQGYKERLYCDFPIPSGYAASVRPMELYVNGCEDPIYRDQYAELPAVEGAKKGGAGPGGTGGTACSAGLDAAACVAAGGTYWTMPGFCDPGPCPSSCVCP